MTKEPEASAESNDAARHPCRVCMVKESRCVRDILSKLFFFIPQPVRALLVQHKWKITIGVLFLAITSYGYHAITREPKPEFITAVVTRGDLIQTVEAVGTVTSERDLKLQFPVSGVVGEVLVNEGDHVETGDRLASLKAKDLAAQVNSALANLHVAQADLQELREGARPEDIAIAEAEVVNKRATLYSSQEQLIASKEKLSLLEREAEISLVGEVGTARSTISQQLTRSRTALAVLDDVMSDNDVSDALIRGDPALESLIRSERDAAGDIGVQLFQQGIDFQTYDDALMMLKITRSGIVAVANAMESLFSSLITLPPTGSFTRSERESRKNDLAVEKNSLQTALIAIDAAIKDLQDASAAYNTKIATERTTIAKLRGDILMYETSLRTEEAELALKKAGSRQTDIDAEAARVRRAQADLDRARADFSETILNAPTTGTITKVNIKTGELLSTAFQQDAAITMLGESPYRIEMYVSEIDIPKVIIGQKSEVELDAFPGQPFAIAVAEIDPAATDVDGVPKYRIKLDFSSPPENPKIGMTGDVDIFTGGSENTLAVPARAVIENDDGKKVVRILTGEYEFEERVVETGLEGEMDIEILSGLQEGETVIVLIKK